MPINKSNIWGYIKNYKWRSVFFSYFKIIILLIIIPFMVFNFIIYQYYNFILDKEIIISNMQTLLKIRSTVDIITNEIDKFSSVVHSNEYFQSFLTQKSDDTFGFNSYARSREMSSTLLNFINTSDCIETIYIFNKNNNYIFSNSNCGFLNEFADTAWYEEYKKRGSGNFTISRNVPSPIYEYPSITISRELYVFNNFEGLLVVNIDAKRFNKLISRSHPSKNENLFISNSEGNILYSNNIDFINKNISSYPELELAFNSTNGEHFEGKRYNNRVISSLNSEINDWYFISSISTTNFIKKMDYVRNLLAFSIFLAISSAFILAFYISVRFYKSITNIIATIQNPEDRNALLFEDDKKSSFNEILFICKNIINIMDSNKRIEHELTKRLSLLRKTQSIALQTQINPHFIFNTLHLINLIIMRNNKGDTEATKIVSLLSDLLRISLETKEHLIPLTLEIKHAEKYLQIQNIKYKDSFDVQWDVQSNALNVKTVKLVLQPLIENAIKYGITPLRIKRTIKISAAIENRSLILKVSDNGVGLTPEQLENIIRISNENVIRENEHIGLSNVNQRIKLIFGKKFGITISSVFGEGTEVTLTMPEIPCDSPNENTIE